MSSCLHISFFCCSSDLDEFRVQIVSRRLELARALPIIFPIVRTSPNVHLSPASLLSICHLPLPSSNEEQANAAFSENHLSAAYGFAAQLLRLISVIADVPLRYPLTVVRCRPHVRDNIVYQLEESERSFQLHLRNKRSERIRFKYAVFLLNRNICLLRLNCGLEYKNLPTTLFNLLELLRCPLTPICSSEVQRAAERINQECSLARESPHRQRKQIQNANGRESPPELEKSHYPGNQTVVPDIFFHGDAVDLTT